MEKIVIPEKIEDGNFSFIIDPYSCNHIKKCKKCSNLVYRCNNILYPYGFTVKRIKKDKNCLHKYPCGYEKRIYLNDYESKHNCYYFIKNKKFILSPGDKKHPNLENDYKCFSARGLVLCDKYKDHSHDKSHDCDVESNNLIDDEECYNSSYNTDEECTKSSKISTCNDEDDSYHDTDEECTKSSKMSTCDDNNDSYHDTEEECTKSSKISTCNDEHDSYHDTEEECTKSSKISTCDENSNYDTDEECTKSSKMSTFDDDNYIENEIYSDTISSIHDDNISYHNDKNDKNYKNDKIIYHRHNHIIETQNSKNDYLNKKIYEDNREENKFIDNRKNNYYEDNHEQLNHKDSHRNNQYEDNHKKLNHKDSHRNNEYEDNMYILHNKQVQGNRYCIDNKQVQGNRYCIDNKHVDSNNKNNPFFYLGNHKDYPSVNYDCYFFKNNINDGNMPHKFDIYLKGKKYEKNGKFKNYPYNPRYII